MSSTARTRDQDRCEIEAIKARLGIADVLRSLVPGIALKKSGAEFVCLSPLKAERTPSFYVHPAKGEFFCFGSGVGGDIIRLAELIRGDGFREALAWCKREAGLDTGPISDMDRVQRDRDLAERRKADMARLEAEEAVAKAEKRGNALALWQAARPACNSLVESYLRYRNIDCDALQAAYGYTVPPTLRYITNLRYSHREVTHFGPVMIGLVVDAHKHPTAAHRTWLAKDGLGKADVPNAKLALGTVWGSTSWLSPVCEDCLMGEGYETTLTALAALARVGVRRFGVSACNLPNMASPDLRLPAGVKRLTLLQDADGKDLAETDKLMRRAIAVHRARGIEVRVATPALGTDFNDMARRARREAA